MGSEQAVLRVLADPEMPDRVPLRRIMTETMLTEEKVRMILGKLESEGRVARHGRPGRRGSWELTA